MDGALRYQYCFLNLVTIRMTLAAAICFFTFKTVQVMENYVWIDLDPSFTLSTPEALKKRCEKYNSDMGAAGVVATRSR